ncbi:MAG: hypothetical protein ACRDPK_03485 [Carbonactinosporaceae bacterium]
MTSSDPRDAAQPDAPDPFDHIEVEPTGDPGVDAAVESLAGLSDLPVEEHIAVYEDVHRQLRDVLAELDGG